MNACRTTSALNYRPYPSGNVNRRFLTPFTDDPTDTNWEAFTDYIGSLI